jgi:DNA-binding MarR family transcriptional regulator
MDWQKYAWVKRGKSRREVLSIVSKAAIPLTINEVHQKAKIAISQASETIAELEQTKLIECLNPKDKIGKLYRITEEGKDIIKTMASTQE